MRSKAVGKVALVSLIGAVTVSGCVAGSAVSKSQSVAYVEALLFDSRPPASEADAIRFCEEWASDQPLCRASIDQWKLHGAPGVEPLSVSYTIDTLSTGTRRVNVVGQCEDGSRFTSAIELVLDGGEVRAVDPVFWVKRTIVEASVPPFL